jgi:hypothetical protein
LGYFADYSCVAFLGPGTIASAGGLFYAIVTHAADGVCLIGAVVIGVAIFWIEATLEKMTAAWLILRVERRLARDLRPRAFSILQLSTGANGGFGSEMAQHEPVARIVPLYRNQMAGKVESRMGAVTWAMRHRPVSHPRSSNRTCRFPA